MNQPWPPADASDPSGLPAVSPEVRNWALAAHLSAFAGALVALAFLGPLVVWLAKRDHHPFIEEHAREALNFNLSVLLYAVGFALTFALIGIPLLWIPLLLIALGITWLVVVTILGITWLVVTIVAAVKASEGQHYRYPLTIRFFS